MLTAAHIVEALGGTVLVADALSIPASTVSSWKGKNSIPAWRRPAVLALAMEKGITLSTADFPERLAA